MGRERDWGGARTEHQNYIPAHFWYLSQRIKGSASLQLWYQTTADPESTTFGPANLSLNKKRAHSVGRLHVPRWDGNGTGEKLERNSKTTKLATFATYDHVSKGPPAYNYGTKEPRTLKVPLADQQTSL